MLKFNLVGFFRFIYYIIFLFYQHDDVHVFNTRNIFNFKKLYDSVYFKMY